MIEKSAQPMNKVTCGAKARSNDGKPCKLPPLKNGRCRFHGGKSVVKHGFYTRDAVRQRKCVKDMIKDCQATLALFKEDGKQGLRPFS